MLKQLSKLSWGYLVLGLLILGALLPGLRAADLPDGLHVRNGLPHVSEKLQTPGDEIRVAFLGGSITAAGGWRVGILAHLRKTYPNHQFVEIFAAIPGTGSDFGAARIDEDVLSKHPDLVFVEFAVNDIGRPESQIRQSMEGIVRKTHAASPATDLCFVYTLSGTGLPFIESGSYPPQAVAMEAIAEHYGIPSLHFGVEVVRQLQRGTLVFTGDSPTPDIPVFAKDKIHPGSAGHRIYTETLAKAWPDLIAAAHSRPPASSAALEPLNWEHAVIMPVESLAPAATCWTPVAPADIRLKALGTLARPTVITSAVGVVLEFDFTGTFFGFYGIKGPDSGNFRVTIDNQEPVDGTLFDSYCTARRYRARPWFYPGDLKPGRHHVRVELLDTAPDKSAVRTTDAEDDPSFAINGLTLSGVILDGPTSR